MVMQIQSFEFKILNLINTKKNNYKLKYLQLRQWKIRFLILKLKKISGQFALTFYCVSLQEKGGLFSGLLRKTPKTTAEVQLLKHKCGFHVDACHKAG